MKAVKFFSYTYMSTKLFQLISLLMVNLQCHLWFLLFVKSTLVISAYLKTWLISKNSKALQFSLNRLGYDNVS